MKLGRSGRRRLEFYIAISPWLAGVLFFTTGPVIGSFLLSLSRWEIVNPPSWVGFDNYIRFIFDDPRSRIALFNTAVFTLGSVPLMTLVALLSALLLNQRLPGIAFFRTAFYLPAVTASVAMAILWLWIFNPEFGILNFLLGVIGIDGPAWLFHPVWVKVSFILMSVWQMGPAMVILLAGLQGVPEHLYEAAAIDGANVFRRFWHVTLPMLSPAIFFVLIIGVIGSFQIFTNVYVITKGGPGTSSLFLVLYIYFRAFKDFQMGYAASLAWVLFLTVLVLTVIQFRVARRWVYYEGADIRGLAK